MKNIQQQYGFKHVFLYVAILMLVKAGCHDDKVNRLPYEVASHTAGSGIPFIAIDVRIGDSVRAAVIPNDMLYDIFEDIGVGSEEYETKLSWYVNTGTAIILPDSLIGHVRPYFIRPVSTVDSLADLGVEILVRHYFDDGVILQRAIDFEEEKYLIHVLFDKGVFTGIEHSSWRLGILYPDESLLPAPGPSVIRQRESRQPRESPQRSEDTGDEDS